MIDLPEFSPSWKFCPARTSREIFCPGPPGIASLGIHYPLSITLIQKIPSKYMNTALPKKTNVTIFTTAQHSLRCRFFYAHTALTTIQHFLFTPTQHSLRFNHFCQEKLYTA